MQEIRCKNCNKLLGKFEGAGEIKCSRASCNMVNKFDTKKSILYAEKAHVHISMTEKKASGGVALQ